MSDFLESIQKSLQACQTLFALLPAVIILEHPIYIYLSRPIDVRNLKSDRGFDATRQHATDLYESAFGWIALSLRYVLPAVVVAGVSYGLVRFVIEGNMGSASPDVLRATKLGAVGAYFAVLLYLSRRVIRHDLTGGGAMLCALTLVLGPVLAGVLAAIGIHISDPQKQNPSFGADAVYFVAGVAPRRIAAAIVEAVTRLWIPDNGKAPPPTRIVPLGQVRGITSDIEERLSEEGVYDVTTLAMADPFLLLRNTSFDLRQILNWMDEALLMLTLPESWKAFEKEGITGAVDLAWYHDAKPPELAALAARTKTDPAGLQEAVDRLVQDAQVRLVWFLYQAGSEELPLVGAPTGEKGKESG